ncbi:hypothetical protein SALBM311S_08684 [Streptomyces alboniger]
MKNRHLRKAVLATAAITAGLLLTACQNGTADSSSGKGPADAASPVAAAEKASDSQNSKGSKNSKGVSGSFKNGKVTYLAPGKYIVSVPGKDDQQFWVADDTEVYGVGTICGEAESKVDAPCTVDQLEAALKKGAVNADVEMKNGVATLVTERRATQQDAGSGSRQRFRQWFRLPRDRRRGHQRGQGRQRHLVRKRLLPGAGQYTVSDMKGTEQQFLVADDTKIMGYDDICDAVNTGPGGEGGAECTEAELETAAKKGFSAEVKISNGIATTITDDH